MILKEAYRYSNHLDDLIGTALLYLRDTNNVMVITEKHMRSLAKADIPDVEKDNTSERELPVSAMDVVDFVLHVVDEKERLFAAIDKAREGHQTVDSALVLCKTKQGCVDTLKRMLALKGREQIKRGSDYCFNADGNQSSYYYDVRVSSKIDFNRATVKKYVDQLTNEIDEASNYSDYLKTSLSVDFTPAYGLNDTFEELVSGYGDMDSAS